jgi:hypothetical protein
MGAQFICFDDLFFLAFLNNTLQDVTLGVGRGS